MNIFLHILIIHATFSGAIASSACKLEGPRSAETWDDFQFEKSVYPVRYNLLLGIDLLEDNFTGNVTITVNNTHFSDYFVLNSEGLKIFEVSVFNWENNAEVAVQELHMHESKQLLVIHLEDGAEPAMYDIHVSFSGLFESDFVGLYKVNYTTDNNEIRFMAATKMQPTYARRVFPCFDDPRFKAKMQIALRHDSQLAALSNMEIEEVMKLEISVTETVFSLSPPMAPQSVGIIIGEFSHLTVTDKHGSIIRMLDRSESLEVAEQILKVSKQAMKFYGNYFGFNYPLSKLDIVALPRELAVETSWGLTSAMEFRSPGSPEDSVLITKFMCKEVAKMWLGHLVSMTTWEDIWVVEALTEFMTIKALKNVDPSIDWDDEVIADTFLLDKPERPYEYKLEEREKNRTTNVLRDVLFFKILENYSNGKIRTGLSEFVTKFSYGSASANDLWTILGSETMIEINKLLEEVGKTRTVYPIINVHRDEKVPQRVILEQKHVWLLPQRTLMNITSSHGLSGQPITFHTSKDRKMRTTVMNFYTTFLDEAKFEWIKFNTNFTGFYIVNYDKEDWDRFIHLLHEQHTVFSASDRANLLHDAFTLSESGLIPWSVFFEMASYLRVETDLAPWITANEIFRRMELFQLEQGFGQPLQQFVLSLTENLYHRMAWIKHRSYKLRKLSRIIVDLQCRYGSHHCLKKAGAQLKELRNNAKTDIALRRLVYVYGPHINKREEDREEVWNHMFSNFQHVSSHLERSNLLHGLASFPNYEKLCALSRTTNKDMQIPEEEFAMMVQHMSENLEARDTLCHFAFNDPLNLKAKLGLKYIRTGRFLKLIAPVCGISDWGEEGTYTRVFNQEDRIEEAFNILKSNWYSKHRNRLSVEHWLTAHLHLPWLFEKLPHSVIPVTYNLSLQPDMFSDIIRGNVSITVRITEPTNYVLINSVKLDIEKTEVVDASTMETISIKHEFPSSHKRYWVTVFEGEISEGTYYLNYQFRGKYVVGPYGITRFNYTDEKTQDIRHFVYTKMEPIYARNVFPCFDEPHLKATYRITAIHHSNFTALSNMPVESMVARENGLIETRFMESLQMPTYLVSLVICDFSFIEATLPTGMTVRYFARSELIDLAERSLELVPKFIEELEKFTEVPMSYPKLDLIALPNYTTGGMENWGLIYLSEDKIVNISRDEPKDIFRKDKTLAHELAHHWFGNLVTMQWWNDIWLNEGLSNLAAHIASRPVHPVIADEVFAEDRLRVNMMGIYALNRPLLKPVEHLLHDIKSVFDPVTYIKGYAIGLMLQSALKDDFRTGLSNYLRKYSFKNAKTEDLWNELSTPDLNFTKLMESWMFQKSFPYIEIERGLNFFTAKQKNIKFSNYPGERVEPKEIWSIPLTYKNLETGEERTHWLTEKEATFPLDASANDCIKFNPGFTGIYFVKYDDKSYDLLGKKLEENPNILSSVDKYVLLHETWHFVQENQLPVTSFLKLTKFLRYEESLLTWKMFYPLDRVRRRFTKDEETLSLWKKYLTFLTEEFYDEHGIRGNYSKALGSLLNRVASFSGNPKWIQLNVDNVENWLRGDSSSYNDEIMEGVIPYIQNISIWEEMWAQYISCNQTETPKMMNLMHGLILYNDKTLLNKTLYHFMENDDIKPFFLRWVLERFPKNPDGSVLLWEYFKDHSEHVRKRLKMSELNSVIQTLCRDMYSKSDIKQAAKILRCYQNVLPKDIMDQCMSEVNHNIGWMSDNKQAVYDWLKSVTTI